MHFGELELHSSILASSPPSPPVEKRDKRLHNLTNVTWLRLHMIYDALCYTRNRQDHHPFSQCIYWWSGGRVLVGKMLGASV